MGELHTFTITAGSFNIPLSLSVTDGIIRQKVIKDREDLSNSILPDLTDIYRPNYPQTAEYIWFWSVWNTYHDIVRHRTIYFLKFKTYTMFVDHMQLKINNKNILEYK